MGSRCSALHQFFFFFLACTNFDAGPSLGWREDGALNIDFSKELFVAEIFSRQLSESFSILKVVERI